MASSFDDLPDLGPPLRLHRQLGVDKWRIIENAYNAGGQDVAFGIYLRFVGGDTLNNFLQQFELYGNGPPYLGPVAEPGAAPVEEPEPEPAVPAQERKFEFKEGPWTPSALICPITQQPMTDPVTTRAGFTYERKAIVAHLEGSNRDPVTDKVLESKALVPNWALKKLIDEVKTFNQASDETKEATLTEIKKTFDDSLLFEPIKKPVMTLAGQTYERDSVNIWFASKQTDPNTRGALASKTLIPNHAFADLHQEFLAYQKYFEAKRVARSVSSAAATTAPTSALGVFAETEAKVMSPQELMNQVEEFISTVQAIQEPDVHLASLNTTLVSQLREFKEKKVASPECLEAFQNARASLKGEERGILDNIIKQIDRLDLKIKPSSHSGVGGPGAVR